MTPQEDRLFKKLLEDLDSEDAARELLPMMMQMQRVKPPSADNTQITQALIERLKQEMPQKPSWREHRSIVLLMSQIRIIRRDLWVASFMMMVLGLALTVTQSNSLIFAMIAPFVAAGGVAFLYDEANLEELENSTQTPASLLLLARLMLLFTFNLVVALVCSVILAVVLPDVSLIPLIASWFAPMAFLSALAFFLSVMLLDTLASILFSLTLWTVHLVLRTQDGFLLWIMSLPGLTAPEMRPLLLVAAGGMVLGAFAFLYQTERSH